MPNSGYPQRSFRVDRAKRWLGISAVCIVAAVCFLGLVLHYDFVNGSPFHRWPWRCVAWWRVYPLTALACVPLLVAPIFWRRKRLVAIALLMFTSFALQMIDGSLRGDRFDVQRIVDLVHNPAVTSYFTEAVVLTTQEDVLSFLANYPNLLH